MRETGTHVVSDLRRDRGCVLYLKGRGDLVLARVVELELAVTVGDALVIRDGLRAAGFVFGEDFVIRKVRGVMSDEH